jgi:hypothetical protein
MRLKRIAAFHPVSFRSGVIASVMQMKRSVQTPVSLVRSLSGLGLRLPVSAAQTSQANAPGWRQDDRLEDPANDAIRGSSMPSS